MSRTFAALTLSLISVGPVRAADTYDSLAEEAVKSLDHLAACLASIKDPVSGEQARAKLAGCTRSFADLKKRSEKLGDPPPEKKDELDRKYRPRLDAAAKKVRVEMDRIAKLDGGRQLLKDIGEQLGPPAPEKK
jgi:hypothetical protein